MLLKPELVPGISFDICQFGAELCQPCSLANPCRQASREMIRLVQFGDCQ